MNILHLVPNEKKFVLVTADIFDACDGISNSYRVITTNVSEARKSFVGQGNIRPVNKFLYPYSKALRNDLAWCDCLVVHFMDGIKAKIIMNAPTDLPIVWSAWGGDFYDLLSEGGDNLLGEETRLLVRKLNRKMAVSVSQLVRRLKTGASDVVNCLQAPMVLKAMKRVDYCSTPFPEEFDLLRAHLGQGFHAAYTRVFYGSVERRYMPGVESIYGDNILVGNSATATNNHLEVFAILSRLELGDRKIIVPLSYGDPGYREAIIERGCALFGDRFQPIIEFMPLDQYNSFIAQCSIVIMGHRRQQGGGNTHTQLYKGAKVFLNDVNAMYQSLKNQGAFVYPLHDLEFGGGHAFDPLTDEQKLRNKKVLESYIGEEVVLRGMRDFVYQIRSYEENRNA